MQTSGSSFDLIMQELLNQKQLLEDLETENRELHRQLAELRDGQGIFVDILGQRFSLVGESNVVSPEVAPVAEDILATQESPTIIGEQAWSSIPETTLPKAEAAVEEVSEESTPLPASLSSEFVEAWLLDDLSTASTRQMAVWSGPITDHPTLDEDEKANLRRELSGSFLLE